MAPIVYVLCAITSFICAYLLFVSYLKQRRSLLLYSLLCFVGLAVNNLLMFVDFVILPDKDISTLRLIPAILGMGVLMIGLTSRDL